jgi:hypothetical protein
MVDFTSLYLWAKQCDIVMGMRFYLAELAIDLELRDILDIDRQELLVYLVIEQYTVLCNGDHTYKVIVPHLAGEPETNTHVHVVFAYIDKDTFQFELSDRSFFSIGHYREYLEHAVY